MTVDDRRATERRISLVSGPRILFKRLIQVFLAVLILRAGSQNIFKIAQRNCDEQKNVEPARGPVQGAEGKLEALGKASALKRARVLWTPKTPRQPRFRGGVAWQEEVLGVCVPYKDRLDQLNVFANHIRTFLHAQGVPFRIYVAEQVQDAAFNRGWALNVAFLFAESEVDYVIFHDVDMLPLPGVDYRFDPRVVVRHLSTEASQFDYHLPYDEYCSGALMVEKKFFSDVNGFSTGFWGWGGEDDEFCTRVVKRKYGGWTAAKRAPGGLDAVRFSIPLKFKTLPLVHHSFVQAFGRPLKGGGRFLSMHHERRGNNHPHYEENKKKLARVTE